MPRVLQVVESEPKDLKDIDQLIDYHWFDKAWEVLQTYPQENQEVLFLEAKALMGMKRYEESLALFHRILQTTTDADQRRESLLKEAMILVRLKRYDEALDVYKRLMVPAPVKKMDKKLAWRAFKVALEAKEYEEGLKLLKHLSGPETFWWRGWCYYRLQDSHAAIRNWDLIPKKNNYYPQVLYWKAQIFKQWGQEERSKNVSDLLMRQFPFNYYGILAVMNTGTSIPPLEEGKERLQLEEKYPRPFRQEVEKESKKRRLDPYAVFAVMWQESRFQESAVSPVGAIGLMQLMPQTAVVLAKASKTKHFRLTDILEREMNIKLGVFYLSFLKQLFNDQWTYAIPAYNAGEEAVSRWLSLREDDLREVFIEEIPFDETQKYTKKVLTAFWIYHWLYEEKPPEFFMKLTP